MSVGPSGRSGCSPPFFPTSPGTGSPGRGGRPGSCIEEPPARSRPLRTLISGGAVDVPVVLLHAIGEKADARSYGVADTAEDLEALGLSAARGRRVRQLPSKLETAARRYGAARVANGDDDIPALADLVDGLARLFRDVDAELAHDRDGKRMDTRRLGTCALDLEAVTSE